MMKDFISFTSQFLEDPRLGELPFFKNTHKDTQKTYSYKETIKSAQKLASGLEKMPESFLALKIESPYKLFIHLIAGIFSNKKLLILSSKLPEESVLNYQKSLSFEKIIYDDTLTEGPPLNLPLQIDADKAFLSVLSSGSTGPSKAIFLSLNNLWSSSASVIDFFQMNHSHTTLLNLPCHHVGGLMILWRAFFSQGMVTTDSENHYDFTSLVPLQLKRALEDEVMLKKLKETKAILIGGAKLTDELKKEGLKHRLRLYETYGMSETSSLVMLNGKPLFGQEIKLDRDGHFLIKGPTLSPNVKRDSDGFYHTKDLGIKNSDGTYSFLQRSDLLFKSAGELINPLEIEDALRNLTWISEIALVPLDHPEWTKAGALVYQLKDQTKTVEDIKKHLKSLFHPYHIPKFFYEADPLLFTPGMKPKRFEILKWAKTKYYRGLFNFHLESVGEKKLMVFFHGFMEDYQDLTPLMDKSFKSDYLFIDLPGHGKTPTGPFKTRDEVFFHLKNMIEFFGEGHSLILYGYSMGGRIALELTKALNVDLLILESASFGLMSEEERELRLISDRKLFSGIKDLKVFFQAWYKNPIFGRYNLSENYSQEIERKLQRENPQEEWQKSLEFFSPGVTPILDETLSAVSSKNIVGIIGSEDKKYKEHFHNLKRSLEKLSLYEIEGAGHNPHKSHIQKIKEILGSVV